MINLIKWYLHISESSVVWVRVMTVAFTRRLLISMYPCLCTDCCLLDHYLVHTSFLIYLYTHMACLLPLYLYAALKWMPSIGKKNQQIVDQLKGGGGGNKRKRRIKQMFGLLRLYIFHKNWNLSDIEYIFKYYALCSCLLLPYSHWQWHYCVIDTLQSNETKCLFFHNCLKKRQENW